MPSNRPVITRRRAYDMLSCLLEAGDGHVFTGAIIAERGTVLPHCRHCRVFAGSLKARERCAGDSIGAQGPSGQGNLTIQ